MKKGKIYKIIIREKTNSKKWRFSLKIADFS